MLPSLNPDVPSTPRVCPDSRKGKSLSPQKQPEWSLPRAPSQTRARSVSVQVIARSWAQLGRPRLGWDSGSPVHPYSLQLPGSLAPPRPLRVPPALDARQLPLTPIPEPLGQTPNHCPQNFLFSQEIGRQRVHTLHPNPSAWPLGSAGGNHTADGP